jgi:phospholipid/cholesterol/gamma-HCH transport system substrate-binding protein
MTSYRKNLMVGLVVMGSLIILGWMILKFGDKPAMLFAPPRIPVSFIAERADGVGEGSQVLFQGVPVGRVTVSKLQTTDGMRVRIETSIDLNPPLPGNVMGEIRTAGFLGGTANVELVLTGPKAEGRLKAGAELPAKYVGMSVLPPEIGELAEEMRATVRQFRESGLIKHLDEAVISTRKQVERAGQVIDSLQSVVGDPKVQQDVRESLANIRTATASANKITADLQKFTGKLDNLGEQASGTIQQVRTSVSNTEKQLSDRLQQLAEIMSNINSVTAKINQGHGTMGMLVNDPKLYEALVDSSRQLKTTIADFNRLVEQWEQEGFYLNLGGPKKK